MAMASCPISWRQKTVASKTRAQQEAFRLTALAGREASSHNASLMISIGFP
jgi:hypothetical protein